MLGTSYRTFPGGKGANQAVACSRAAGARTQYLGAFGADDLGAPIEASLQAAGVQLHKITFAQTPTGTAFICVSAQGENAITVVPGANACLKGEHLPSLADVSCLLLQLETPIPTLREFAIAARREGVRVILNAAPAQPQAAELLEFVDVLIVNEGELEVLSPLPGSIVERMAALPVPNVVATLGARGCIAKSEQGYSVEPSFAVPVVDTTAAGDTFCGTLAAELGRGTLLASALRIASAAAALACTRAGAQTSIPTHTEVLAMLAHDNDPTDAARNAVREYCGLTE